MIGGQLAYIFICSHYSMHSRSKPPTFLTNTGHTFGRSLLLWFIKFVVGLFLSNRELKILHTERLEKIKQYQAYFYNFFCLTVDEDNRDPCKWCSFAITMRSTLIKYLFRAFKRSCCGQVTRTHNHWP